MCFVLYAGTARPLPRRPWNKEAPDLSIASLTERDVAIKAHFSKPEVQYIGSTSGCSCDFPFVALQKGEWPFFAELEKKDPKQAATDKYNRESLVGLLRSSGEETVELYGVWSGDFAEGPRAREDVLLEQVLEPDFRFKERGFYRVKVG
jgi:hypothetical protein